MILGKLRVLVLLAVLALIITVLYFFYDNFSERKKNLIQAMDKASVTAREEAVLEMMGKNFINRYDLVVDEIEGDKPPDYVLLESMGQMMEYAVLTGNKDLFDASWDNTVKYMRAPEGYFYWRIGSEDLKPDCVTALVDEVRVAVSLADAARVFNNAGYAREAAELTRSILRYSVEGDLLCDLYDGQSRQREMKISLFYIEPRALREMAILDREFGIPAQKAVKILEDAPIDNHGFFPTWFDYRAGEYGYSPAVNMVEALYTARNARESGRDISSFMDFLGREISAGRIYNSYNRDGTPAEDNESAAVYALAGRLFLDEKDNHAVLCYRKLTGFQITEKFHPLAGGFGDANGLMLYAFDQMESLLALHIGGKSSIADKI